MFVDMETRELFALQYTAPLRATISRELSDSKQPQIPWFFKPRMPCTRMLGAPRILK